MVYSKDIKAATNSTYTLKKTIENVLTNRLVAGNLRILFESFTGIVPTIYYTDTKSILDVKLYG